MSTITKNVYEGLFLFPQSAAGDLQAALEHVTSLLDRAGAEVISLGKWDERRLAYEIEGNKRGVYFLAYFAAEPSAITGLERTSNLSEQLIRFMVVRAEHVPKEVMEAAEGRAKLADEISLRSTEGRGESGRPSVKVESRAAESDSEGSKDDSED